GPCWLIRIGFRYLESLTYSSGQMLRSASPSWGKSPARISAPHSYGETLSPVSSAGTFVLSSAIPPISSTHDVPSTVIQLTPLIPGLDPSRPLHSQVTWLAGSSTSSPGKRWAHWVTTGS